MVKQTLGAVYDFSGRGFILLFVIDLFIYWLLN